MKLLVFTCFVVVVNAVLPPVAPLTRTKIESNGIYKLQNQHDGRFLTAGNGGVPTRQEWRAGTDQKFTFVLSKTNNEDSWKLTPIDNMNALVPQWKITYVGHGKSQFKSFTSGLCLQAEGTGRVGDVRVSATEMNRNNGGTSTTPA